MNCWAGVAPRFDWRPSQLRLLEAAGRVGDRQWHLCAPPGAGKTLIGLELARRLGVPTLVLSPTTAVRDQWREAVFMFGADPMVFTASDPAQQAPLLSVTYQLLGNPGEAAAELAAAGRRLWVAEVAAAHGEEVAADRIAATEAADPARARRELGRHVRALRRSLAGAGEVAVPYEALLGERSVALIEALAQRGVGCVVLDECHHLLDWWALVLAALIGRLGPDVAVIGLTATLPDTTSEREAENYRRLLGDVDAELPLAALVAEGMLAPWRDGVHVAHLTGAEESFVAARAERFATDLDGHLVAEGFLTWAVERLGGAALDDRQALTDPETTPGAWAAFWDADPLGGAALARWWAARGLALPAGFDPPPGVDGKLDLEDRLVLVDLWLHDPVVAPGTEERKALTDTLRRHGVAVTTAGLRWGRSVADVVCARSSAKGPAAATILAAEAERRGEGLRALVVVERDTAGTPPAAAREVLGEDAGTAARILAGLCGRGEVLEMGVMAVTGRGAWADAISAERICAAINTSTTDGRWVRAEGCDIAGAVRLVGQGRGWGTSRWLAAATDALDDGAARVLLATRALVGEGWDHPPINVLVDLSEAASASAVTQLRGRAIRLDPADPTKVASLWDVVVAHGLARGDWDRLRRRHARWWGPDAGGRVVTGPAKLHPLAGRTEVPDGPEADRLNDESAASVADVAATMAAWGSLDPGGAPAPSVHVRSPAGRRRRVRTRGRNWLWAAAPGAATSTAGLVAAAGAMPSALAWPALAVAAAGALATAWVARGRRRGEKDTLLALGDAVAAGMAAAGDRELRGARVAVEADPSGGWIASAEGLGENAAARWADALAETLGPLGSPRWLVTAGGRAWRVPTAVGASREAAEAFTAGLHRRVPGVELVRAGTPAATLAVLAAARERGDEIDRSTRWR